MHPRYAPAVIALVGVLSTVRVTEAAGLIGCLFSRSLCDSRAEWCYDDYAFGKCLPYYEDDRPLDLYQYDLNQETLYQLRNELEKLMLLGYRWGHPYTQCVLKSFLFSVREGQRFDENICYLLADDSLRDAVRAIEGDGDGGSGPSGIGQFRFTPRFGDPRSEFYDEVYYPAVEGRVIHGPEDDSRRKKPDYLADLRRLILIDNAELEKNYQKRDRFGDWVPDGEGDQSIPELLKPIEYVEFQKPKVHFTERYNTPEDFREGFETKDFPEAFMDEPVGQIKTFSRVYNTPGNFRRGMETRDDVKYPAKSSFYEPQEREYLYDTFADDNGRVYTEGGSLDLREGEKGDETPKMEEVPEDWGFKRRERLDVKKPGPAFKTNNYAFETEKPETETVRVPEDKKEPPPPPPPSPKVSQMKVPEKKKFDASSGSPASQSKKEALADDFDDSPDEVDTSFAYMQFKDRVTSWQEGSRIVRGVEEILKLDENTFSETRVDPHEVTFKVEPNKYNLNATDVARKIDAEKSAIKKKLGVDVISTGVGDQAKLPVVMNLSSEDEHQLWILSFLLCGVIAALAIAGAAFFVIKRHSKTRQKIKNLTQLDSEVSKDYQDLCRARMATKSPPEKPESGIVGHRITSLARESEGSNHSPSSRSSTSSWSEEPALTNMDISTGHMVLSYMEDHLKNKDRLEQEWVALCAYEAEPCATTVAEMPENSRKNRYGDILPYDHARVTLKELSNMTGSNYINASTITDHDPRNPAYIATQGPLPETAPDFWQMVWEQGSVVMVMLTRLTENGSAMCHRYWPEEGSALYHIYEVHLVSEHIWCDDYLVRSFYLKNIQTGETRTVTQFHFLSWPENGVPLSTKALLEFRRKVNKSYRGRSCPIVVHCSDGVGRTGTYCLIDMVLNRMAKGAKEIDIAATLEHIRDQRPFMVRTKQQFEFVLMAVAEEVHAILKALPNNHSPSPILKDKE